MPPHASAQSAGTGVAPGGRRRSWEPIYSVVRQIPKGRVATYGQVARLAGLPGHARQVGYALAALEPDSRVPWQRVINAQGRISPRSAPGFDTIQRRLLKSEGIAFEDGGRIDLERYGWRPRSPRRSRP